MSQLIEFLKQVKDFRKPCGQRHPLWFILLIVILGFLTGHLGYRALGDFAKAHQEALTQHFGIPRGEVPSYSTIRRAMMGIDCDHLIEVFNQWASQLLLEGESDWLAIDGKCIKSITRYEPENSLKSWLIVSCFSQERGLVLSINKPDRLTSEIDCVQDLVRVSDFHNQVFTLDALHCQKKTVNAIVCSGNDYLMVVKKNQKTLYKLLENTAHTVAPLSEHQDLDVSHGRQIVRTVSVFSVPQRLQSIWQQSRSFVKVERCGKRGSKPYHQIIYCLSSRQETASVFARKIRGHWLIENQLHWVKDVIFQEDTSSIHQYQPACNISTLKNIAINLLRSLGFLSITEGQRWLGDRFWRLSVLLE